MADFFQHLPIAAACIGIDLNLFDLLAASDTPMTVNELQSRTGAAPVLLGMLRDVCSSPHHGSNGIRAFIKISCFGCND